MQPPTRRPFDRFPHPPRTPEERAIRDVLRRLMTGIGMARDCPLAGCARARRCVGPRLTCFSHHHAELSQELLPELRRALQGRLDETGRTD